MEREEVVMGEFENGRRSERPSGAVIAVFGVILFASILLSVLITFSLTVNRFATPERDLEYRFRVMQEYLDGVAYFETDEDVMLSAALHAYVEASGDPYTEYYDAEEYAVLNDTNAGRYVGIGVMIVKRETVYDGRVYKVGRISNVYDGSGAAEAGLVVGDEIYGVVNDGKLVLVDDVSYTIATSMIRGEVGSYAELVLLRTVDGEKKEIRVSVPRREITTNSVSFALSETDPSVGIISISTFDLTTPNGLKTAMNELLKEGAQRFVIDLRDNGGGDLASVLACASYFLEEKDVILSTENKSGTRVVYRTEPRAHTGKYTTCDVKKEEIGMYRGYAYAVLTNGNTASAAELLTAVFRDYEIGIIAGETTYGKGSMQTIYSLEKLGIEGGLKVTTRMYFPPCGEGYNGIGITPDLVVEQPSGTNLRTLAEQDDSQLLAAIGELSPQ